MLNYYRFLIPRLNGAEIREKGRYYRSLVKKGVAGFIVFGGRIGPLRTFIAGLQAEAEMPLIIASDLEQGLGQQVMGGTLFPPSMALASAAGNRRKGRGFRLTRPGLLRSAFRAFATEAGYAGINTILAPVLDINSNPDNPIIAVRSFGEDAQTVSAFGCEMISEYRRMKIVACGKHFPGHGDTDVDSHLSLPVIRRSRASLENRELRPFRKAVESGVDMIMLGHLSVPALDASGVPASLSEPVVRYLRKRLGFGGLLITDAMNMGGLGGYSEEEASAMAMSAGVDILLHPADPDRTVYGLRRRKIDASPERLDRFRKSLDRRLREQKPDLGAHEVLAGKLSEASMHMTGKFRARGNPFLAILNDDSPGKGKIFADALKKNFPGMKVRHLHRDSDPDRLIFPAGTQPIVAVFTETRAWKGGVSDWMKNAIAELREVAGIFIAFGSPYALKGAGNVPVLHAYWDSPASQTAAAGMIAGKAR